MIFGMEESPIRHHIEDLLTSIWDVSSYLAICQGLESGAPMFFVSTIEALEQHLREVEDSNRKVEEAKETLYKRAQLVIENITRSIMGMDSICDINYEGDTYSHLRKTPARIKHGSKCTRYYICNVYNPEDWIRGCLTDIMGYIERAVFSGLDEDVCALEAEITQIISSYRIAVRKPDISKKAASAISEAIRERPDIDFKKKKVLPTNRTRLIEHLEQIDKEANGPKKYVTILSDKSTRSIHHKFLSFSSESYGENDGEKFTVTQTILSRNSLNRYPGKWFFILKIYVIFFILKIYVIFFLFISFLLTLGC